MASHPDLNWDFLRIFLAVMRSNSLRKAAEQLEISHPTIRRRLESLESQLGLRLFDRRPDGLQATPEASELMEVAEQVEASVNALSRCAQNSAPQLQGRVHVSAPDLVMSELLAPALAAFTKRWPQVYLHIETTYELADLSSREADIAIRAMPLGVFPKGKLTGRKAATVYTALYGSGDRLIGWWGNERDDAWLKEFDIPALPIIGAMENIYLQRAVCREGMGLAHLPCFMAENSLERQTEPKPAWDIWVLVHPDLRRNPRLRLFRDEIVTELKRLQPQLEGKLVN